MASNVGRSGRIQLEKASWSSAQVDFVTSTGVGVWLNGEMNLCAFHRAFEGWVASALLAGATV